MNNFIGIEAAIRKTAQLAEAVRKEQSKVLNKIGLRIVKATKENIMALAAHQESLASRVDYKTGFDEMVVGYMGASHAPFFEFGTGIAGKEGQILDAGFGIPGLTDTPSDYEPSGQPITPKSAKMLHWKDRETGEDVFALSTRGQAPHPALRKAMADHVSDIRDTLAQENVEIAQEIARA